jgi:hypothetical protein
MNPLIFKSSIMAALPQPFPVISRIGWGCAKLPISFMGRSVLISRCFLNGKSGAQVFVFFSLVATWAVMITRFFSITENHGAQVFVFFSLVATWAVMITRFFSITENHGALMVSRS